MPTYDFSCGKCKKAYEQFANYDPTEKYAKVKCPHCNSKKKTKIISNCIIAGTDTQMGIFGYRAGKLYEKAQGERRFAEANSHMGASPFNFEASQDFNLGEGIFDPETRPGLS